MLSVDEILSEFQAQKKAAGRFAGRLERAAEAIDNGKIDLDLADALDRHAIHLERRGRPEVRFVLALIDAAQLLRSGDELAG